MSVDETAFLEALLDPERAVPAGLVDPAGRPAGRRFDVYRNNVVVSLTEALETAFPVVEKLVGEAFFTAMAGVFVRQHPPEDPRLGTYGAAFPGFLARFPPVAHLGYLPDIARLEQARRESYHAADAPALDAAVLTGLAPDALSRARFDLAPALRLLHSPWPVLDIWRANTEPGAPAPGALAQDVLITRPGFDPEQTVLGPGGADFIAALGRGATLGEATSLSAPGLDITATLGALLAGGAITGLKEATS